MSLFIASLHIRVKRWKHPEYQSNGLTGESWLNKPQHIHSVECYTAITNEYRKGQCHCTGKSLWYTSSKNSGTKSHPQNCVED